MRNLILLFCNTYSLSLSSFRASKTITKSYFELGLLSSLKCNYSCSSAQGILLPSSLGHKNSLLQQRVHKSTKFSRGKGSSKEDQDDDDYEYEGIDSTGIDPSIMIDVDGKETKIIKAKLNSMRLDSLLKAGLGIAKNKVETAFYESRIRVNGDKILKKSKRMQLGDEIDVIKGANATNSSFLDVSRVLVVAVDSSPDLEKFYVILKRYKALTIENYPTAPYRKSINEDQ